MFNNALPLPKTAGCSDYAWLRVTNLPARAGVAPASRTYADCPLIQVSRMPSAGLVGAS